LASHNGAQSLALLLHAPSHPHPSSAGNTAFSCENVHAKPEYLPGCREFELLIRKIMSQPERPVVAPMQIMLPLIHLNGRNVTFTANAESGILALSDYYYLPHISMRNAMWHLQHTESPGFTLPEIRDAQKWHINALGHAYAADLVMHALWKGMQAVEGLKMVSQRRNDTALAVYRMLEHPERFPAMMPDAEGIPTTWLCSISRTMQSSEQVKFVATDGAWAFQTDDKHHEKWGYITSKAGSVLNITWTPSDAYAKADHAGRTVTLMIGYLKSYNPIMSSANVSCVSGCQCPSVFTQGYDPKDHTSVTMFADVHISQPKGIQPCTISVAVNTNERKETAKFKINSVIVLESAQHTPNLSGGSLSLPHGRRRKRQLQL
jgi:hypothetical protein